MAVDLTRLASFVLVIFAVFRQNQMSVLVAIFVTLITISLQFERYFEWRRKLIAQAVEPNKS
jgi:hypothetical protein